MTTPPCTECIFCTNKITDPTGVKYYYCAFDEEWINEEYAKLVDLECDMFEQKLDDNKTKKSRA